MISDQRCKLRERGLYQLPLRLEVGQEHDCKVSGRLTASTAHRHLTPEIKMTKIVQV